MHKAVSIVTLAICVTVALVDGITASLTYTPGQLVLTISLAAMSWALPVAVCHTWRKRKAVPVFWLISLTAGCTVFPSGGRVQRITIWIRACGDRLHR